MMMIGATFLLPAVLSLLGRRAFAVRMPWARRPTVHNPAGSGFARYGQWLQHHYKVVGGVALAVVVVLALPIGSMRLGFTDDGGRPEGSSARIAYDLLAEGFGPGLNGPFIVTAETAEPGDNAAVAQLAGALGADPGVAVAIPFPMAPDSSVTAIQVIPTTSPQAAETEELLVRIRGEVIPPVAQATGLTALVGGTLAITSDFTTVLTDALPLFLLVVIGFGFLALVLLFRSILVPLTGVVTSLLSLAAAMGVTVAVFQWGWLAELIGVSQHRADHAVPADHGVRDPLRAVHGLPGVPCQPDAGGVGPHRRQRQGRAPRPGRLRPGGHDRRGHHDQRLRGVRAGQRADDQAVRPRPGLGGAVRRVRRPADHRAVGDVPAGQRQLVAPGWLGRILPNVAVESEEDASFEAAEIDDIPDEAVPTPSER